MIGEMGQYRSEDSEPALPEPDSLPSISVITDLHDDWLWWENGTWEDPSLLNVWNMPTYPPDESNMTPRGTWDLNVTLNVTYGRGQYWAYYEHHLNGSWSVFGSHGQFYNDTGPFTIGLNTSDLKDGWIRVTIKAVTAEPWIGDSMHYWHRWVFINDSLTMP